VLAAALSSLALASAGHMPCVEGQARPVCAYQTAKVVFIADGDTIRVRIRGVRGIKTIRFTGLNAMELHRYSKYPSRRRGDCHGLQATALAEREIKRSHGTVRLVEQDIHSRSNTRLRRSVWAKIGGRWRDVSRLEMQAGLALWLPNGQEWAHNAEYHLLAEQARGARRGLYDPTSCGAGPDDDLPLRLDVNWDADHDDAANLDGEWVRISNGGARPLRLAHWWLRDSWLRYSAHRVPGYAFPASAVVPAGGTLTLHVGSGRNTATDLYWGQHAPAFENVTHDSRHMGDGAYLFDPQGDLRASAIYPCMVDCTDPAQGNVALRVHPRTPESVDVVNTGGAPLDLGRYVLKIHDPGHPDVFVSGISFAPGSRLAPGQARHVPLGPNVLRDSGNAVSLRTYTDIVLACAAWGSGRC